MTGQFSVQSKTIRNDMRDIGNDAKAYLGEEYNLEMEIGAVMERLKERAQRDDAVGNRADELLLNIYGNRSAQAMRRNLEARKLRLQEAQEELTREKAKLTRLQTMRAEIDLSRNSQAQDEFRVLLNQISEHGQVGFGDIVGMTSLLLRREIESEAGPDIGRVTSFLNLLYRIAEANPPTDLSGQHFQIPASLFEGSVVDLGDDLMPQ
jgi:hypothetical protein